MTVIAGTGMVLVLLAGTLLYLASPNQLLWLGPLPRRALGLAGGVGVVAGLVLLLQWAGAATAVFVALTLLMLVWTLVPMGSAWWRGDRKAARKGAAR